MISLTRLSGTVFLLNADLIERVDSTPDTVVTLVDGTKYVVSEPLDVVLGEIVDYRARIVARAPLFEETGGFGPRTSEPHRDPTRETSRETGREAGRDHRPAPYLSPVPDTSGLPDASGRPGTPVPETRRLIDRRRGGTS